MLYKNIHFFSAFLTKLIEIALTQNFAEGGLNEEIYKNNSQLSHIVGQSAIIIAT